MAAEDRLPYYLTAKDESYCPTCHKKYSLRMDGRIRRHNRHHEGQVETCPGSGELPRVEDLKDAILHG